MDLVLDGLPVADEALQVSLVKEDPGAGDVGAIRRADPVEEQQRPGVHAVHHQLEARHVAHVDLGVAQVGAQHRVEAVDGAAAEHREGLPGGAPGGRRLEQVQLPRLHQRLRRRGLVPLLRAHQAQVVPGLRMLRVLGGGLLDERRGPPHLAQLEERPPHQEGVHGVLVGRQRQPLQQRPGLAHPLFSLVHQGVELEQHGVHQLLVGLGELDGLLAHLDGLQVVPEGVYVDLSRVEHGLEVGVIEGDGLAISLDGLVRVAIERRAVPEQVVGLGRLGVELQGSTCRGFGPSRVVARDQFPTPIEVRRKLVHEEDVPSTGPPRQRH